MRPLLRTRTTTAGASHKNSKMRHRHDTPPLKKKSLLPLGPRPSDPSKISFALDCFEIIGYEDRYTVMRGALHSGPAVFDSKAEAEAYARKVGRTVSVSSWPIRRRTKWF